MKRPLLETRRQVVSAIIGAYPGGRECAAARLGLDLKKFDNHAYENAGSKPLSDDQLRLLEQEAGTTFFPEYIAQLYSGMFVALSQPETLDNLTLYSRSVRASIKRGAVDLIIAKALE
ncbi:YmfL family putative regulatory protein, partial [Pseudomonas aeruginosa]